VAEENEADEEEAVEKENEAEDGEEAAGEENEAENGDEEVREENRAEVGWQMLEYLKLGGQRRNELTAY